MARFKPGQKVVCIRKAGKIWRGYDSDGNPCSNVGPEFNEIVTVSKSPSLWDDAMTLEEYQHVPPGQTLPCAYAQQYFEPLMDITELTEILESQPAEV